MEEHTINSEVEVAAGEGYGTFAVNINPADGTRVDYMADEYARYGDAVFGVRLMKKRQEEQQTEEDASKGLLQDVSHNALQHQGLEERRASILIGQNTITSAIHWPPQRGSSPLARAVQGPTEVHFDLSRIDAYLGRKKPPAVEYLFVEVLVSSNPCDISQLGRWGHSAIRYTLPNGVQKLVNVARPEENHQLIEFYDDPSDYILGVKGRGGIFSRDMVGIRIEDVTDESIWALHYYFLSQSARFKADGKGVSFDLLGGFWKNALRSLFRLRSKPSGNCARWVSRGLVQANLIKRDTMYPKSVFVEMLEDQVALNAPNVNVVYYRRIKAAARRKPYLKTGCSFYSAPSLWFIPKNFAQNIVYWNLKPFANVILENDPSIPLEDMQTSLKCHLVSGEGRRIPSWVVMGWRTFDVLFWTTFVLFYTFYCKESAWERRHNGANAFPGTEILNASCSNTWPSEAGWRLVLALVVLGIHKFWLY